MTDATIAAVGEKMSPWRAWSRGRQRDRAASSCPSGRQETGIPRLPNPNHHRNAECRRAPLTPYLLPGERLLHLRPRRINLCRSSPYAHSSTTAASAVASASSNVNRCLPPCGFAGVPCTALQFWDPVFSKRSSAVPPCFAFLQNIGGRPHRCHAVGCWSVGERSA